jgi:hypothetical protein
VGRIVGELSQANVPRAACNVNVAGGARAPGRAFLRGKSYILHGVLPRFYLPGDMTSFGDAVSDLTDRYLDRWSGTPATLPDRLRRFSPAARAEKEREVELLLEKSLPRIENFGEMEESERARHLGRAHTALGRLMTGNADPSANRFFTECESAGKLFVRRARLFDSSLSERDIHQALRNQWVFNSIQSSLSHPVTLTSASLGYSLMYPYTDNWLDGRDHTPAEKDLFNRDLRSWIAGDREGAPGECERGFPGLLRMIEQEYPRSRFPAVYESLLAIHRAQLRSLILQGPVENEAEPFLQALTIEKGGTSVAVDGYLVSGTLGGETLHALFGYGVVLQFIDDLQDIPDDAGACHSTLFTRICTLAPLDDAVNRLLNFTCDTIRRLDGVTPGRGSSLSGLIEGSCVFLIMEAVARYPHFFSDAYLRVLEEFSPLRFSYLGGLHDRVRNVLAEREHVLFPQ